MPPKVESETPPLGSVALPKVEDDWDYETKKTIIKYDVDKFIFRNQSLTTLANDIFRVLWGYIPSSYYNKECLEMMNKYSPEP